MNDNVRKYGPPAVVLGVAIYLGWPPPRPLDLNESTVRAKTVRWKRADLERPETPPLVDSDPFASVLVGDDAEATTGPAVPDATATKEPTGPSEMEIREGLRVDGIARTDAMQWVIINGGVCKPNDLIPVTGLHDVKATIQAITNDRVIVSANGMSVTLRLADRRSKRASKATTETRAGAETPALDIDAGDEDSGGEIESNDASSRSLTEQFLQTNNR